MFENMKKHLATRKADELGLTNQERQKLIDDFACDKDEAIETVLGDSLSDRIYLYAPVD